MKNRCLIILLLMMGGICKGQFNLVPNPSFEDTVNCPQSASQVDMALGWYPSRITPDYYNSCAGVTGTISIPNNFHGYQYAHSGVAYCGFVAKYVNGLNVREHFTCQLINPLVIGIKYYVSFYLSLSYPGLACNKIGTLFSTINYNSSSPSPVNNYCQFFTDSIITDTLNWVLIQGNFIADSSYSYLSMGNFFDDTHTDTLFNPPASYAYYYIDDICVSTDSLTCNSSVGINNINPKNEITFSPNPFTTQLTITTKTTEPVEVTLYDVTSRKMLHQKFTGSTAINTTLLAPGIYLYELRNKNGVIKKGKVVKE